PPRLVEAAPRAGWAGGLGVSPIVTGWAGGLGVSPIVTGWAVGSGVSPIVADRGVVDRDREEERGEVGRDPGAQRVAVRGHPVDGPEPGLTRDGRGLRDDGVEHGVRRAVPEAAVDEVDLRAVDARVAEAGGVEREERLVQRAERRAVEEALGREPAARGAQALGRHA